MSESHKVNSYWSLIPDSIFSLKLSPESKLVLMFAASRPNGWVFRVASLRYLFGLSEDRWRKTRNELVINGYLRFYSARSADGKYEWILDFQLTTLVEAIPRASLNGVSMAGGSHVTVQEGSTSASLSKKEVPNSEWARLKPRSRAGVTIWNKSDEIQVDMMVKKYGEESVIKAASYVKSVAEPLPSKVHRVLKGEDN